MALTKRQEKCYYGAMEKIRHIGFESRNEYKTYLQKLFEMLDSDREYNIFAHQINGYYSNDFGKTKNPEKIKLSQIMKYGLELGKYSSVCGTTKMLGSTKNFNLDKIVDYEYYESMENKMVCLFAIPKFIEIDGQKIEFSSYNDFCGYENEDLKKAYAQHNLSPDAHHFKSSLFDAIKGYDKMPKCFMMGVQWIRSKTENYHFLQNKTHISFLSRENQDVFYDSLKTEVSKKYEIFDAKNTLDLIVKSYKSEQVWRDQELDFEI